AREVPSGSANLAVHSESRPNSVRNQGLPAAAKASPGCCGSVRRRADRSAMLRATRGANPTGPVTVTSGAGASPAAANTPTASGSRSTAVTVTSAVQRARAGTSTRQVTVAPGSPSPAATTGSAPARSVTRVRGSSQVTVAPSGGRGESAAVV